MTSYGRLSAAGWKTSNAPASGLGLWRDYFGSDVLGVPHTDWNVIFNLEPGQRFSFNFSRYLEERDCQCLVKVFIRLA
jgi:hypothetical protein